MVELSDKEIAESFGKIALMFEDLKKSSSHKSSIESYVNNEYADELKSFRELKQFNRSQPDIVDNWLECFNNFRMKHKALFAAFMNTDNYRKMRLGNKVICRYSDDELDEMGQELYIRIVTIIASKVKSDIIEESVNGRMVTVKNIFRQVYYTIVEIPDPSATQKLKTAFYDLHNKVKNATYKGDGFEYLNMISSKPDDFEEIVYKFICSGYDMLAHVGLYTQAFARGYQHLFLNIYAKHFRIYKKDLTYKLPPPHDVFVEIMTDNDYPKLIKEREDAEKKKLNNIAKSKANKKKQKELNQAKEKEVDDK